MWAKELKESHASTFKPGNQVTWQQQVGGRAITPTYLMEIASHYHCHCARVEIAALASSSFDSDHCTRRGQSKHGLHCSSRSRSSVLRQINHLAPDYWRRIGLLALEAESQRRQSSVPVRRKQKLGAVSRLKLSTTAALLPS